MRSTTSASIATAMQLLKLPDGTVRVLVEGVKRARLVNLTDREGYMAAEIEEVDEEPADGPEAQALMRSVLDQFENYAKLNKRLPPETGIQLSEIDDASLLADAVASNLSIKVADKQALLGELNPSRRLEMVFAFMEGELGVLQVEKKIRSRVKRQMEKTQREYYLNEQLKAIQRELGNEGEEGGDELAELAEKIRKTRLSKEARLRANAELKKLRAMAPMSAEATVARNYLDVLLGLPWGKKSKLKKDIAEAQAHPRRGPLRAREGQGPDRRISRGPGAHQQAEGPDPLPRRTARRRQDVARPLDRARDGPRVRPSVAGRSPRRGRDPRPPPDLYRLASGQDRFEHQEGRDVEPAVPARRDRQARAGLPRRSVVGAARGPRSGAEQQVPGPLSRARLRPFRRDVRDDRELARHAAAAARPHGDHPARGLYRGREGRDRQAPPHPQADGCARAEGRTS